MRSVIGGAIAVILVLAAHAAQSETRVALVIGNSAYKETPLLNPGNDASDMAQALLDLGFKVILRRNANTRAMRAAIREFAKELRRADVGLFYFAGHGVQVRGSNYLIPTGGDIRSEADVEDMAIDANYVLRTMEDAQVKVNIVILDACRNNPFAGSFRSATRGLAQMTAATGSLIAFSTAPGSVAADGSGRNGLYTHHLLENIRQSDSDILRVFQRTRASVVKETAGRQVPWESTSLTSDFYFRQPDFAAASVVKPATEPVAAESKQPKLKPAETVASLPLSVPPAITKSSQGLPQSAQLRTWNYQSFNQQSGPNLGYVELDERGGEAVFRIIAPGLNVCFQGNLPASVERSDQMTVVTVAPKLTGCEEVRFLVRNDGRGGRREIRQGSVWKWDGLERLLTSR